MTKRIFITVAIVLMACDGDVVVPAGTQGAGASNATSGAGAGDGDAGGAGTGGAAGHAPQNCWGCDELATIFPIDETKLPNACPGAHELALAFEDCMCSHCNDVCGTCTPGVPPEGCAPCLDVHCAEVRHACAIDKRIYDPTKE